jgi:DNA-binding transcriptional ArsR family regulator
MFRNKERDDEIQNLKEELEELKKSIRELSETKQDELESGKSTQEEKVDSNAESIPETKKEPIDHGEEVEIKVERPRHREHYERPRSDPFFRDDFGERLGEYIAGFVDDVMEGVNEELERSLFSDPHFKHRRRRSKRGALDAKEASNIMSALGNEHRLKILGELSYGGAYAPELQEYLSEISPSTLSSHLDVLEEAGLINQERRRGRYLITMPGRLAVKMAYQISDRIIRRDSD